MDELGKLLGAGSYGKVFAYRVEGAAQPQQQAGEEYRPCAEILSQFSEKNFAAKIFRLKKNVMDIFDKLDAGSLKEKRRITGAVLSFISSELKAAPTGSEVFWELVHTANPAVRPAVLRNLINNVNYANVVANYKLVRSILNSASFYSELQKTGSIFKSMKQFLLTHEPNVWASFQGSSEEAIASKLVEIAFANNDWNLPVARILAKDRYDNLHWGFLIEALDGDMQPEVERLGLEADGWKRTTKNSKLKVLYNSVPMLVKLADKAVRPFMLLHHLYGMGHFDVKPANLLFHFQPNGESGELRVVAADFGLAGQLFKATPIKGSLPFIAPEVERAKEGFEAARIQTSSALEVAQHRLLQQKRGVYFVEQHPTYTSFTSISSSAEGYTATTGASPAVDTFALGLTLAAFFTAGRAPQKDKQVWVERCILPYLMSGQLFSFKHFSAARGVPIFSRTVTAALAACFAPGGKVEKLYLPQLPQLLRLVVQRMTSIAPEVRPSLRHVWMVFKAHALLDELDRTAAAGRGTDVTATLPAAATAAAGVSTATGRAPKLPTSTLSYHKTRRLLKELQRLPLAKFFFFNLQMKPLTPIRRNRHKYAALLAALTDLARLEPIQEAVEKAVVPLPLSIFAEQSTAMEVVHARDDEAERQANVALQTILLHSELPARDDWEEVSDVLFGVSPEGLRSLMQRAIERRRTFLLDSGIAATVRKAFILHYSPDCNVELIAEEISQEVMQAAQARLPLPGLPVSSVFSHIRARMIQAHIALSTVDTLLRLGLREAVNRNPTVKAVYEAIRSYDRTTSATAAAAATASTAGGGRGTEESLPGAAAAVTAAAAGKGEPPREGLRPATGMDGEEAAGAGGAMTQQREQMGRRGEESAATGAAESEVPLSRGTAAAAAGSRALFLAAAASQEAREDVVRAAAAVVADRIASRGEPRAAAAETRGMGGGEEQAGAQRRRRERGCFGRRRKRRCRRRVGVEHGRREEEEEEEEERRESAGVETAAAVKTFYDAVYAETEKLSIQIYRRPFWQIHPETHFGLSAEEANKFVKQILLPFIAQMWPQELLQVVLAFSIERAVASLGSLPEESMPAVYETVVDKMKVDLILPLPFSAETVRQEYVEVLYGWTLPTFVEQVVLQSFRHLLRLRIRERLSAVSSDAAFAARMVVSKESVVREEADYMRHVYALETTSFRYGWEPHQLKARLQQMVQEEFDFVRETLPLVRTTIRTNGVARSSQSENSRIFRILTKTFFLYPDTTVGEVNRFFTRLLRRSYNVRCQTYVASLRRLVEGPEPSYEPVLPYYKAAPLLETRGGRKFKLVATPVDPTPAFPIRNCFLWTREFLQDRGIVMS